MQGSLRNILWRIKPLATNLVAGAVFFATLSTATAQTPSRSAEAVVTGVHLSETAGATRLALDMSRRLDHQIFFLSEPMRAVIDLPAVQWRIAGGEVAPSGVIAGLRYGAFDAKTGRLVLDLAQPVRLREAHYDLPAAGRKGQRLVLDFERATPEEFARSVQPWSVSGVLRAIQANAPAEAPAPQAPAAVPRQVAPAPQAAPLQQAPVQQAFALPARPVAPAAPVVPAAAAPAPRAATGGPRSIVRPTIIIDPGHGGVDPGAIGRSGTHEKDVTLAVSREVRRQLEQSGKFRVHLTRDEDIFIQLRERIAIARRQQADMFISIHADSMGNANPATRGASIYTLSENASDSEAAALAQRENRADIIAGVDLSRENRDVTSILIDLAQRETMNHSIVLARQLVRELGREIVLLPQNPHRFAGFAVLRSPDVPSVLIELGYLSNRDDEELLTRPQHRSKVAGGIVRAVEAYFQANPVHRP